MTPHRWFLAASFGFSIVAASVAVIPSQALAQSEEMPVPEVENTPYQFMGTINANSVYVRSGPNDNYYPTMKLDKGTTVTVVGIQYDWLKVLPPEGSFCYVSKAFVEKRGDGSIGRVMKPDLSVRAGSMLSNLKSQVQTKLNVGEDVEIIREEGEYFVIKPPVGTYVYINKKNVTPGDPLTSANARPAADSTTPAPVGPFDGGVTTQTPTGDPVAPVASGPNLDRPVTDVPVATNVGATNAAQFEFDKLEAELRTAATKPLDQQPLDDLQKRYEALIAGNQLPGSLQRIAQQRLTLIKQQQSTLAELNQIRKDHDALSQQQKSLQAEQAEIQQRLDQRGVQIFTAVGALWPSSLQAGTGGTLYRLTDPATGRTIVYIRSDDNALMGMSGQFIGVQGKVETDTQLGLKVIPVLSYKTVDPTKVSTAVMAQFMPPSLLSSAPTASVGSEPH